jgi:hypothetical protein
MIAEESNTSLLSAALAKVVGGSWQIGLDAADGPRPASSARGAQAASEPDPRDDSEPDPPAQDEPAPDPEAAALRLLRDQLGASPVDEL